MEWSLRLTDPPAIEPVTLDEAKLFLRVDHDDEDTLIESLISGARSYCENAQHRAYITQTWTMTLDRFPSRDCIILPRPPLQAITDFQYRSKDGGYHTFSDYAIDASIEPGRLYLTPNSAWPADNLWSKAAVTIEYECGYGDDPSDIPVAAMQMLRLLIAQWYEYRESSSMGHGMSSITMPFAFESLIWQDKVFPFHPAGCD